MAVLLALGVAGTAGSCVSLLGLEGYGSAANELCSMLQDCYGPQFYPSCLEHADPRLNEATAEAREAWLTMFADSHCLESCQNANACLDAPPVCGSQGAGCGQREQCCGFLTGKSECSRSAGLFGGVAISDGACCVANGVSCNDSSQCCATECIDDVCGGIPCQDVGVSCTNDFECCTDICNPITGRCHDSVCIEAGGECADGFECCDGVCQLGEGGTGICGAGICGEDGAQCIKAVECCNGYCHYAPTPQMRVCSHGECAPDAVACDVDEECCSDYCDPEFKRCGAETLCLPDGDSCETNSQCCGYCAGIDLPIPEAGVCACRPDGVGCSDNFQCCSADGCIDAVCAGGGDCHPPGADCAATSECCTDICRLGTCCEPTSCHDVCQEGVPLATTCECESCGPKSDPVTLCALAVCAQDGYNHCCCVQWDQACVERAKQTCQIICAAPADRNMPGG